MAYRTSWERLTEAAIAYADACAEDDRVFACAKDNLRKAAQDYYADLEARKGHAQSLAAPEQMMH
jgi:hypothetical protein